MRSGVAVFRLMPYIARNEPLLRLLAQDVFSDESSVSGASFASGKPTPCIKL